MKIFYLVLLALSSLSYAHGSLEEGYPPYGVEPTEDQLKMAREPDFCVRLAKSYDPEVIDSGRPFVEEFLNPATVDGHGHPLMFENFDIATIIFDTVTLAFERKNEGVLDVLSPVFKSDVSPRVKAETSRLVTTLPIGDQEGFVTLWKDFYEENAHPDVHEKIVKCVVKAEAETTRKEKGRARSAAASKGKQVDPYVFEGHTLKDMMDGGLWEGAPVLSLIQNACPLETFLIGLSEALFLFPEDQRLGKTMGLLAQYPAITRPVDVVSYVMKEGDIDKELHRVLTFLSPYGKSEFEVEGLLSSIIFSYISVSPIITIKDLQDIEGKVREVLDANEGVIDHMVFNEILRGPYLKWKDEHKKSV
ncbi:MAG TPA: hypothetical protein DD412_07910 [Holosporales bacterium]|nr:hypothetical protein [Holosporales bacterium]